MVPLGLRLGSIFRSLPSDRVRQFHLLLHRSKPRIFPKKPRSIFRFVRGTPGTVDANNDKDVDAFKIIKKTFPYFWPKGRPDLKRKVLLSIFLLIIAKTINMLTPYIYKTIVDKITETKKLGDLNITQALKYSLGAIIIGYGLARVGTAAFNELKNALFARVSQSSIRQLSLNSFRHLQQLDLSFHLSRKTGMISKSIDRGTRGVSFILTALAFNLIPTTFEIFAVTTLMGLYFGPTFACTTLGCVSTYVTFTYLVTRWRTKYRIIMNQADNECSTKAVDSFLNYETVKYFNNEKFELKEYDKILEKYENASRKTITSLSALNFGQSAIFTAGIVAAMTLATNGILIDSLTLGDLIMANNLLFQLSIPLNFLGSTYRDIRQSLVDLQSLFDLLKIEVKMKDSPNSKNLVWPKQLAIKQPLIEFKDVTFCYGDHKVLDNVSFIVPCGKKIALVGGSGSGKSTIVRLLYRFIQPQNDYNDLTLESLRRVISVVPQDQVLFHNTIMYNIKYGNVNCSDKDVYRAAKVAGLHPTVMKFPHSYQTQVGERGLKLSGGEKQRVAIARAVLKDAPIFIYDEATSSLDSITEKGILNVLSKVLNNRTSIVIAHRLSTVVDADEILVLKDGKIVEKGRHLELLINNPMGVYAQLWHKQHEVVTSSGKEGKMQDVEDILNDIGCPREGCCSK